MKQFEIPAHYRSALTGRVKAWRKAADPRKKDLTPAMLDFGPVQILLPRHMGFCYGVENAIEIAWKAIAENPGKRLFLLSQMIHNPAVNRDLEENGIRFLLDTEGNQLVPWEEVRAEDVVITPAFGTTLEIEQMLREKGVETSTYNTTCPFVEKVWKRSAEIGAKGYTVVIHGKARHEETRATFSHSAQGAPSIIIRDQREAELLARAIRGEMDKDEFYRVFAGKYSAGFDPAKHLSLIGVVNQTTMLASETQEIADYLRGVIHAHLGDGHFADTRDTLCYATNDNQDATKALLGAQADLAVVIGGHNSSNTSQLVTILGAHMPAYFITGPDDIVDDTTISYVRYGSEERYSQSGWLPNHRPVRIIVTSGASCPDTEVDAVILRILSQFPDAAPVEKVLGGLLSA